MYVNHRPAFGLSPFDLNEAFTQLGSAGDEGFAIDRDRLLSLLQNKGMRQPEEDNFTAKGTSRFVCKRMHFDGFLFPLIIHTNKIADENGGF